MKTRGPASAVGDRLEMVETVDVVEQVSLAAIARLTNLLLRRIVQVLELYAPLAFPLLAVLRLVALLKFCLVLGKALLGGLNDLGVTFARAHDDALEHP